MHRRHTSKTKGSFGLLPDNLSWCIIWWEALILLDRKKWNNLYEAATVNPSVRSLTDFYQLAISYPAKFLPFSGQINEAKITLTRSSADSKEGKNYRKPNGKYTSACFASSSSNWITSQRYIGAFSLSSWGLNTSQISSNINSSVCWELL